MNIQFVSGFGNFKTGGKLSERERENAEVGVRKVSSSESCQVVARWPSGKTAVHKDDVVMGIGLHGVCTRGEQLRILPEFLFGGQHYDEILAWFGALHFGEIFRVNFGRSA
jgi:hypothetical protein